MGYFSFIVLLDLYIYYGVSKRFQTTEEKAWSKLKKCMRTMEIKTNHPNWRLKPVTDMEKHPSSLAALAEIF